MEMYWNERQELKFQVHMKPNQKLKYLNGDSTHMPSTFRAIPNGVFGRLSKLTSRSKKLDDTPIDEIYPHHAKALKIAEIAPEKFPTFKEVEALRNKYSKAKRSSNSRKPRKKVEET